MSARGPVPNLAEAIAGAPIRGSWWGHPQSHHMYGLFEGVCGSGQVLVCRLVGGKVTFIHRRLWPALVRLADQLPKRGLAAVRDEHTARGNHRTVVTRFPLWVPGAVLRQAKRLSEVEAVRKFGAERLRAISGRAFAPRDARLHAKAGVSRATVSRRRARARRA